MLWNLVSFVLIVYAILCAALFFLQGHLVFYPSRDVFVTPATAGLEFEDVWMRSANGERVHGWWLPGAPDALALIFFHGNAGNVSHRLESLQIFRRLGLQVLIIDYRGFGLSDGAPGERATYEDAELAWRHVTESRAIPADRVVLFGRSLGGGVATWLASQHEPAGLMLESTFSSVPDLASQIYPIFPVRWLARIRYPTRERLAQVRCPVLIVHSADDELIPYSHGEALYAAAATSKTFLRLRGGHNDGFLTSGSDYTDGLRRFLDKLTK